MFTKSVIGPALLTLSLFAAVPALAAGSDPSIDQVYQAATAGRFDDAQAMMDKVLHDHPNSAKAHYIEADLLAKQNRLRDAQTELNTAERLDPSLKFAKPQALQELQSIISGPQHVVQQARPVYSQPVYQQPVVRTVSNNSGSSMMSIIVIIGLVALFFFILRMIGRRNTVVTGGYPVGYGQGANMQGGYGPGMMGGQGGGGIGSGILGGLATGAAVGAGIVAGEELMHHFTDRDRTETVYDTPQNNNYTQQQDDMGGNDFGVSDSSSWDSGGGGGGSDDWN
jgi:hypothetical protein